MPVDFIGMLKALFLFLYKFCEALLLVLPDLLQLIRSWSDYWQTRNARYKQAVANEVAAKIKAAENQSRKEQANLKAALCIYEKVWQDTYKFFKDHLESDAPELALLMLQENQFPRANEIIFNSDSPVEIKAQMLTDLVRKG